VDKVLAAPQLCFPVTSVSVTFPASYRSAGKIQFVVMAIGDLMRIDFKTLAGEGNAWFELIPNEVYVFDVPPNVIGYSPSASSVNARCYAYISGASY